MKFWLLKFHGGPRDEQIWPHDFEDPLPQRIVIYQKQTGGWTQRTEFDDEYEERLAEWLGRPLITIYRRLNTPSPDEFVHYFRVSK